MQNTPQEGIIMKYKNYVLYFAILIVVIGSVLILIDQNFFFKILGLEVIVLSIAFCMVVVAIMVYFMYVILLKIKELMDRVIR